MGHRTPAAAAGGGADGATADPGKEAGGVDSRTVFVRNVSYDVDDAALAAAFGDVGPTRSAFLVRPKGAERHKGFGFVTFALAEDAERAIAELQGAAVLGGRKLRLELASRRAPLEERKRGRRERDAAAAQAAQAAEGGEGGKAAAAPAKRPRGDEEDDEDEGDDKAAAADAAEPPAKTNKKQKASPAAAAAAAKKKKSKKASNPDPAAREKHVLVRTVAIGNLAADGEAPAPAPGAAPRASLARALAIARALPGFEELLDPPPEGAAQRARLAADGCPSGARVVFAVFKSVREATAAVEALQGRVVAAAASSSSAASASSDDDSDDDDDDEEDEEQQKGKKQQHQQQKKQQQQQKKKKKKGGGPKARLWARQVAGEGAHVKKWRVILRNLPFDATEADVRRLCAPSFVWRADVPRVDGSSGSGPGRGRGFAFAAFTDYRSAAAAIAAIAGGGGAGGNNEPRKLRGRAVAADWAVAKMAYAEAQRAAQAQAAAGVEGEEDKEEDDEAASGSGTGSESGSDDSGSSSGESGEASDDEDEDEEGTPAPPDDGERAMVAGVLDSLLGREGDGEKKNMAKEAAVPAALTPAAPAAAPAKLAAADANGQASFPPQNATSRTVFVRGLALDATAQELQARFERFGPVKAARLVVNKALVGAGGGAGVGGDANAAAAAAAARHKGTAFVEFRTAEAAAAAAAACARARAGRGPQVVVGGRALEVDVALDREAARGLATAQAAVRGGGGKPLTAGGGDASSPATSNSRIPPPPPGDRRRLYLAREGHIDEGSAAWGDMSERDRAKRKRAAEERNAKLASPNFAVSPVRLSVRNVPPEWDEAQLKRLFVQAVRQRATKERPVVRQVKLLREGGGPGGAAGGDDDGPASGRRASRFGKSKGIGFVEFDDASHALVALRQLNNNPAPWGRERRPIVEFAIDNVKVLKAREEKLKAQAQRQARSNGGGKKELEGGKAEVGRKAKKPSRIERRQARKQAAAAAAAAAAAGEGGGGNTNNNAPASAFKSPRAPVTPPAPRDGGDKNKRPKATPPAQPRAGKRPADDRALDALVAAAAGAPAAAGAGAGAAGGKGDGGGAKRHRRAGGAEAREEARLDALVAKYRSSLMGGAGGGAGAGNGGRAAAAAVGGGGKAAGLRRWFDEE